jgi:hypothetical protein
MNLAVNINPSSDPLAKPGGNLFRLATMWPLLAPTSPSRIASPTALSFPLIIRLMDSRSRHQGTAKFTTGASPIQGESFELKLRCEKVGVKK